MKTGLLSFRKYIPSDVVRQVVHSRKTAKIFVEKKNITVFFSDLKNFTSMSESLDPDVLVSILGEHLIRDGTVGLLELVKNGIGSVVDEMVLTVVRIAYASIMKDTMDLSSAFCDSMPRSIPPNRSSVYETSAVTL